MEFPGISEAAIEQQKRLFFARQISALTTHFYQLYNVFLGPTLSLRPYETATALLASGAPVTYDIPGPNIAVLSVQNVNEMLFLRVLLRCRLQEAAPRLGPKRKAETVDGSSAADCVAHAKARRTTAA